MFFLWSVSEETTEADEEQVDPEVRIMLNVEEDETEEQEVREELPAEAAESCRDVETPRKKKKSKKDSGSLSTNVSIVEISSDSSFSTKKKKDKERPEEVEEQQQEEEVILEKKKKKKKSKKGKMEQDEMQENLVETPANPLETRSKRRKMAVREEQHEGVEVVREVENPASPVEMPQKKKKRRRSRSRKKKQGEAEMVQSDGLPAGGDRDPGKEPEETGRKTLISFNPSYQSSSVAYFLLPDGDTPQLSTNQKKRRSRKKLSRLKRQRLLCREKRSSQMSGHKKKSVFDTDEKENVVC